MTYDTDIQAGIRDPTAVSYTIWVSHRGHKSGTHRPILPIQGHKRE